MRIKVAPHGGNAQGWELTVNVGLQVAFLHRSRICSGFLSAPWTMTEDEIAALKVPAANDCVLFLCRCYARHCQSHIVWVNDPIGTGYWTRNCHELVLIGTRGNVPCPAPGDNPPSVIHAPRGRHSEKPAIIAEWIERMFPSVPKLEMFARVPARPGWDAWGAESETEPYR